MNNNIIGLDTDKNETKAAIEIIKRSLPEIIERSKLMAKIRRASYLAYIDEGFTDNQAIILCQLT